MNVSLGGSVAEGTPDGTTALLGVPDGTQEEDEDGSEDGKLDGSEDVVIDGCELELGSRDGPRDIFPDGCNDALGVFEVFVVGWLLGISLTGCGSSEDAILGMYDGSTDGVSYGSTVGWLDGC